MLKLCENGSNIDYLYETSSVLRKATETEISGLTFWLWFDSVRVFKNRNRTEILFPHIPSNDAYQFQDQRSKVNVTRSTNVEIEIVSPTNFKLGRRMKHALSAAMASYKGV